MPMQGPNDTEMYLPHEAYNAVGLHLFGSKWTRRFSGSGKLPHPGTERQEQDAGIASKASGDPTDEAYHERQRHSFRESKVFNTLVEALQWRKTIAWCRQENRSWSPIPYDEWEPESDPFRHLHGELLAVLRDNQPSSGALLIEKEPLDEYLRGYPVAKKGTYAPAPKRRERGRPSIPTRSFIDELQRRKLSGELGMVKDRRAKICDELLDWYYGDIPQDERPKAETLRSLLKPELDRIEAQQDST